MFHALLFATIIALPAQDSRGRQAEELPFCFCDTLSNGMTKAAHGKQACMGWHKNNAFLSHTKELPADSSLPKPEGPGGGDQMKCVLADPNIKTGGAAEFEEGWQGGCPSDHYKCIFKWQEPEWKDNCAPGFTGCQCDIYRNGAHPVRNADHMCVTTEKTGEDKEGKAGEQNVCTPPANGYEERFGESLQNYGCQHPARPCINYMDGSPACKACFGKPTVTSIEKQPGDADKGYACKYADDDGLLCLDESIKVIPAKAFQSCGEAELISASMPGITEVGENAFKYSNLQSVSMPEVREIKTYGFGEAGELKGPLYLPKVKKIGVDAFYHTDSLTSIDLPEVTELDRAAFSSSNLVSISFPKIKILGGGWNLGSGELESIVPKVMPDDLIDEQGRSWAAFKEIATKYLDYPCCTDGSCSTWCFVTTIK